MDEHKPAGPRLLNLDEEIPVGPPQRRAILQPLISQGIMHATLSSQVTTRKAEYFADNWLPLVKNEKNGLGNLSSTKNG